MNKIGNIDNTNNKNLLDKHLNEFLEYYEYLVQENEKYNLTAITNKEEVFVKHFEDSVILGSYFDFESKTLLDVGSGAGFPGIPLKICYPNLKVTIIEPTLKRVNFMKEVIKRLNLKDIEVICGRAEDLAKDLNMREKFDYVSARAVANLSVLLELLTPFAKVNGKIVPLKGDKGNEEMIQASNALKELNCTGKEIIEYKLSNDLGNRTILVINKDKKTDKKYPRKYSEIKRKPL